MSDIVVKFSYGCKNIVFELNPANKAFLIFCPDWAVNDRFYIVTIDQYIPRNSC